MPTEETPFQSNLARAIKDHLRAAGSWPSRFSREVGHSAGWLADKLNPRRSATLTIPNIEAIAEYAEVETRQIFADAFPFQFSATDARALTHAMSEEYRARTGHDVSDEVPASAIRLSPSARGTLLRILKKKPKVTKLVSEIDVRLLGQIQDSVWQDRTTAFEKAIFQAEELAERPRKLFTLIGVIALLSDLFRTLRTSEYGLRLRLLKHCYGLLDRYPHAAAEAVVAEKVAYLLWNVESDAGLCCRVLENENLTHHPIPARLFAARAAFQHTAGNNELALAELAISEKLTKNHILHACVQGMIGSVQIALGEFDKALKTLRQTLNDSKRVPVDLQSNNLALLGKVYGCQSDRSSAIESYQQALTPSYCRLWPDKAAYAALELKDLKPGVDVMAELQPVLAQIQYGLLPNHPVESELRSAIQEMIAAATTHSSNALMRQTMDPNG